MICCQKFIEFVIFFIYKFDNSAKFCTKNEGRSHLRKKPKTRDWIGHPNPLQLYATCGLQLPIQLLFLNVESLRGDDWEQKGIGTHRKAWKDKRKKNTNNSLGIHLSTWELKRQNKCNNLLSKTKQTTWEFCNNLLSKMCSL